jgi:putative ABC transport system substrate-binding protein
MNTGPGSPRSSIAFRTAAAGVQGDAVRRRDFTTAVVAAALWPALVRAQVPKPAPRIGVLAQFSAASQFSVEFRRAMRDLGYVEGQNLAIEFASAAGRRLHQPSD